MKIPLETADRCSAFRGRTYIYPTPNDGTREIGVTHGLGTTWIVAWLKNNGSRVRVKTHHLVSPNDPDELQRKLDAWTAVRRIPQNATLTGQQRPEKGQA